MGGVFLKGLGANFANPNVVKAQTFLLAPTLRIAPLNKKLPSDKYKMFMKHFFNRTCAQGFVVGKDIKRPVPKHSTYFFPAVKNSQKKMSKVVQVSILWLSV
jgi:hypothetical protein